MNSEYNNELDMKEPSADIKNDLSAHSVDHTELAEENAFSAIVSAAYEDFPEGFDEMSDEDLLSDLEALANELQDFTDIVFPSDVTESFSVDGTFSEDNNRISEDEPFVEEEVIPEEISPEKETFAEDDLPEETLFEETDSIEDTFAEDDLPEETLSEETDSIEDAFAEDDLPEETLSEETDSIEDASAEDDLPEEATAETDNIDEFINDLVDELEDNIPESGSQDETVSTDELLLIAEELADNHAEIKENPDNDIIESEQVEYRNEEQTSTEFPELEMLAEMMNGENMAISRFMEGVRSASDKADSEKIAVNISPEAGTDILSPQKEASSLIDDEEDQDIKVFVKKNQPPKEPKPIPAEPCEEDDPLKWQLDKTLVNIPMPAAMPRTEVTIEENIEHTNVFDPILPQPSYGETGKRYSSHKEISEDRKRRKKYGFFRGLALISGLLVAVVFISWLLSVVAFSVMGEGDDVSAEEYDYSTTSTIIKPFKDDQAPEPIIVPEFTAEKLTIGDSGDMVDAVQKTLASLGYLAQDKVSGTYDNATKKAVTQFQKANFLEATGEVDSQTYALIFDTNASAPTTRTTDLPTTTTTETTTEATTETTTISTSAQEQKTSASSSADSTTSASSATDKESVPSSQTDKQTEAEPTKPTTAAPSSQEESSTDDTNGTTASEDNVEGPVG